MSPELPASAATVPHRLAPLLTPRSIALVGASPRKGSVGNAAAIALQRSGFAGPISFVNDRYDVVEGRTCIDHIAEIGAAPDLAILNVGARRLEAALRDAIMAGARAAVIFDACEAEASGGGPLRTRLREMAREAGVPVCGGNGMGFFNITDQCHASFYSADHLVPGGISLIAHSGSVFTVLAPNDARYSFDMAVSSGQEIGATIDEYVDFCARRPATRVIALFMESARDPAGFEAALATARDHDTPVVVCKVGRSAESARLAVSHSGALAGSGAAYDAVMEKYGAISVATVDELMNAAMVFAQGRVPSEGEAGLVTDSGGLRELFIDRAQHRNVPIARLSDHTCTALKEVLPANLPPSNPLDCAGAISDDFAATFEAGLEVFASAPEIAMLGFEIDAQDDHVYSPGLAELAARLPQLTGKPCFVYSSFSQTNNRRFAAGLSDACVPVLNGLDATLSAIDALRRLRDARQVVDAPEPAKAGPETIFSWRERIASGVPFGEAEALRLLADFGVPATPCAECADLGEVLAAANGFGYPVVLKSAVPGLLHKSDVGGVVTGLAERSGLAAAYERMAGNLGPRALVQPMAASGVEMAFGYVRDPDFGPLVMVSAGGTLIETIDDRSCGLAPFGPTHARRLIERLAVHEILQGARGRTACDVDSLAQALSNFSVLCATLGDGIAEADVNPMICTSDALLAVDALISPGHEAGSTGTG